MALQARTAPRQQQQRSIPAKLRMQRRDLRTRGAIR